MKIRYSDVEQLFNLFSSNKSDKPTIRDAMRVTGTHDVTSDPPQMIKILTQAKKHSFESQPTDHNIPDDDMLKIIKE